MKWELYRWVWVVKSPVHIGYGPSGSINRTRLYIPARNLWGALTSILAQKESNSFPNYRRMGSYLKENLRFTYMFPAEKIGDEWYAWLPQYREGEGLVWYNEGYKESIPNLQFRSMILDTVTNTAIEPATDTVELETLRETEVLTRYWKKNCSGQSELAFIGYVLCKTEEYSFCNENVFEVKEIFVGGKSRYGLGRLHRIEKLEKTGNLFGYVIDLDKNDPIVIINSEKSSVPSHLKTRNSKIRGEMEILVQWDIHRTITSELLWKPGSVYEPNEIHLAIVKNHIWEEI